MKINNSGVGFQPASIRKDTRWAGRPLHGVFITFCLLLFNLTAAGQQLLDRSAFTVGATHRDPAGQDWAYIAWQSNDPSSLAASVFAVYAKTGDADSAASYSRRAVVRRQTDPQAISALLDRSTKLGMKLPDLNEAVDGLFRDALPPGNGFTLGQKLSTVFRTAPPDKFQTLLAVGRLHAGFNMALGLGAADPIAPDATQTWEVREFGPVAGRDLGVIGRVTLTAGVNTPLPAPGRAWEVRDHPEKDDSTFTSRTSLVIPLRWSTPDELRRVGLGHYGFNVWRMNADYAVANGFDAAPPTAAQLRALAAQPAPPVRRANKAPVLSDKAFTDLNVDPSLRDGALKFIDDRTILFSDDNGRQLDGTNAFADGDTFYYFITARDILGHDGAVSPPAWAKACEIIPPDPPAGVKVEVLYDFDAATNTGSQRLKVSWNSAPNAGRQKTVRYHVYRWSTPDEMTRKGRKPDSTYRLAVIDHVDGQPRHDFIDVPPDPAGMVNDQGTPLESAGDENRKDDAPGDSRFGFTWYYTVRAEDSFACRNFSPHSIAAFGTLRDREGPQPPTGEVLTRCFSPRVVFTRSAIEPYPEGEVERDQLHYIFECRRQDEGIAWAEFAFFPSDAQDACVTMQPVRILFPAREKDEGGTMVQYAEMAVTVPEDWISIPALRPQMAACRVAGIDGRETPWVRTNNNAPPGRGERRRIVFTASMVDSGYQPDCPVLIARPPGVEEVLGTKVKFAITSGTRDWKLYRKCDSGPLTLIKSGIAIYDPVNAAANQLTHEDREPPFGVSMMCYFVQVSDRHGNASPLQPLLPCIMANIPPAPLLAPVIGGGTATEPLMIVRFFSPVEGIDHFEILMNDVPPALSPLKASYLPGSVIPAALKGPASAPFFITSYFGSSTEESIAVKQTIVTGPVGTGNGAIGQGPLFTVAVPKIDVRVKQKLVVRAVTRNGITGKSSNGQTFEWRLPAPAPEPVEDPCLPWPARSMPQVVDRTAVKADILAMRCTPAMMPQGGGPAAALALSRRYPVGIRVGALSSNDEIPGGHYPDGAGFPPAQGYPPYEEQLLAHGGRSFNDLIYKIPAANGKSGEVSLFPIVVYRTQVANPDFPAVSSDLIQVTPLIERVAEKRLPDGDHILKDPYFLAALVPPSDRDASDFILLDTQPVLKSAAYRYFIVRFGTDGEIERVITTNTVTITP